MASRPYPAESLNVIPAPRLWQPGDGELGIRHLERVIVDGTDRESRRVARLLAALCGEAGGRKLPVQTAAAGEIVSGSAVVRLLPAVPIADSPTRSDPLGRLESYRLTINPDGLELAAPHPAGLFYGVQTIRQLLGSGTGAHDLSLPCGIITDEPRFPWRGMLLDCGRHFMEPEFIKDLIDQLALHKFNVLHWHLTEDQGWRLEVPGLPELTKTAAWRIGPDGERYGGFYTSAQVRQIVAYAADRFITIVPEIEMPGHSVAALAAYPELSCTGGPFEVETQWGVHVDVYCAGREKTFIFLQQVLDHVVELFPGPFIHIGGDECPKDRWRECERCQERIDAEDLDDEFQLQSWFIRRIQRYLATHDRRLIGWDEILEGGLAPDATVQAWRGTQGAVAAARAGHEAIVSPTSHAYFDYDVGVLDLLQVYGFEPVPEALTAAETRHILGGEMNLWTEYIPQSRVHTMLFPRVAAMAERLWSPATHDFAGFHRRLTHLNKLWHRLGILPGAAGRPVELTPATTDTRGIQVQVSVDEKLRTALGGKRLEVRHRIVSEPSAAGFDPVRLPEEQSLPMLSTNDDTTGDLLAVAREQRGDSKVIMAGLFVDGAAYGAPALLEISDHLGMGSTPDFTQPPNRRYPGDGPQGLVNGLHGSRSFRDGRWSGFEGTDLEVVIELKQRAEVRRLAIRFIQDANAWIYLPDQVEFSLSNDGHSWQTVAVAVHDVSDRRQEKIIEEFAGEFPLQETGFVRVRAKSPLTCPPWHPGAGQPCWIFADEIVIQGDSSLE